MPTIPYFAQLLLSAGCCHCYTTEISNLVTNKEFLPPHDFLALARKASSWSAADKTRRKNIETAIQKVPDSLRSTSFGKYFPSFIATVCNPDGFNFHERTHNSNGKWIMANLIKASLGKCSEISIMYLEILVCEHEQCYFRVHSTTTHSRRQPHSDPTIYQYTSDVVVMSFRTDDKDSAVEWMRQDSPRTPKCIIADVERSSLKIVIDERITKMKSALKAYSTQGREVLGLVLGGNLELQAVQYKHGDCNYYDPLHGKDLSEVSDIAAVLLNLNVYLHSSCLTMNNESRSSLPIVRSRSSSVASFSETSIVASSVSSHYNLRPRV